METYEKIGVIGRGAYGICYLCHAGNSRFRRKVVIKTVLIDCRTASEENAIQREAHVLGRLAHPNIISFYNFFISNGMLHMVMEYAVGGTVENLIRDQKGQYFGEDMVLYYFTQITMALEYIHSKKILHRDLKPQNILLNRKRTIVKLADFGIARELSTRDVASTMIGTPNYLSPEICEGRKYDTKSDLWSLGCILFEIIELKRAFDGDSFPSIVLKITTGKVEPMTREVSDKLRELVTVLLSMNEKKRPSTKEILTSPLVLPKCLELHLDLGRIDYPSTNHFVAKNATTSSTPSTMLVSPTRDIGISKRIGTLSGLENSTRASLPLEFYLRE
uniref:non-specific serine/threonine protein kinase n=1 Tax=Panagrolaimus superbus TaxID=310955 RepID=A0A914YZZ8_9BILA